MRSQSDAPQCGLMVLAASPELDDKFSCRLLLGSQDLATWLEKNQKHVGWKDRDACDELLLWLQDADTNNNKIVGLSQRSYDLISGHIGDLVGSIPRLFRCLECGTTHEHVKILRQPISDSDIYCSWYVLWICQNGHILYRSLRELHISPGD